MIELAKSADLARDMARLQALAARYLDVAAGIAGILAPRAPIRPGPRRSRIRTGASPPPSTAPSSTASPPSCSAPNIPTDPDSVETAAAARVSWRCSWSRRAFRPGRRGARCRLRPGAGASGTSLANPDRIPCAPRRNYSLFNARLQVLLPSPRSSSRTARARSWRAPCAWRGRAPPPSFRLRFARRLKASLHLRASQSRRGLRLCYARSLL